MNKLDRKARAQILQLLCEGMAIRAVSRVTGASKNTIAKLLVSAGHACAAYQDQAIRNLTCKRVQLDEIWSFVYAKAANVERAKSAPATRWRRLDLDRYRRGHQADCELVARRSRSRRGHDIRLRS